MAKDDQKNVQDRIYGQADQANKAYSDFSNSLYQPRTDTYNRATDDYNGAFAGYSSQASGGNLTQADIDKIRAAGSGGGGGSVSNPLAGKTSNLAGLTSAFESAYRPDYTTADTGYKNFADTGGIDQSGISDTLGKLKDFGVNGGISAADDANVNRDTLKEFEQTGGYSDADKSYIRSKSAANAPAFYAPIKDSLAQGRNITGNYAGAGAVDFKLARQQAQQGGADRTNSEIALGDSIRTGRMTASDTLAKNYLQELGLRTGNQLTGLTNAGNLDLSTQQLLSSNKLAGLSGLASDQTNLGQWGLGQAGGLDQFGLTKASGLDSWTQAQAQAQMSADSSNAAASRAAAGNQQDLEKWLLEYGNDQKSAGVSGLNDLYKTNLDSSKGYADLGLTALDSQYGTAGNLLGLAAQNRGRTGMENATAIGSALGGAAVGGITGGLTNPGYAPRTPDRSIYV